MANYPKIDKLYKHYKGGTYRVKFLSKHTTTGEELVNYQSIEWGSYHSRPLSEWFDTVTTDDNKQCLRFSIINEA
jgi:hypothetical protein